MERNCQEEIGGLSPNQSKSFTHEDDPDITTLPNTSTKQHTESSDKKDMEPTRTHLKDGELQSSTDDLSGRENSYLIPSSNTTKPLAIDLTVHIKEVPVYKKQPFEGILTPPRCEICDTLPQLPVKHLKDTHSTAYKTRAMHRHRKISRSSTSTSKSRHTLKAPGEDLCASLLLACLFCKLWDCVLAVGDGCQYCVASICSSLCTEVCCCDPSSLETFIDLCPCCSCTEYMEACGCACGDTGFDCSICDVCLQTTECLELGMEMSQLMFH